MDRREIARLRADRAVRVATRNKRALALAMRRARFAGLVVVLVVMVAVLVMGPAGML
ncbi:hypothetical protein SAMN05444920_102733 [Nonomuraea solani]|uniref:Uncharacterized protein n=1 Tax=Nonomuraea solani TaxID=1144553 RepID=A0A1H5ZKL5_9ACTN|nr:hypothetical protein [Nonomuraea solani]SEG36650.1 hypothetical protein SAMN05444920_102733 [Nonomuraea solani]